MKKKRKADPELERRQAVVDSREAACHEELAHGMQKLDELLGSGAVTGSIEGDTAVHRLRLAARAGARLAHDE